MIDKHINDEFDWFALDAQGRVALFATAGEGFVPDAVSEFRVMHDTVAGSIEYPNWGSANLWDDAAKLGLFVFDWKPGEGPYVLAASPSNDLDSQLELMVSRITNLPTYAGAFAETRRVGNMSDFLIHH